MTIMRDYNPKNNANFLTRAALRERREGKPSRLKRKFVQRKGQRVESREEGRAPRSLGCLAGEPSPPN